MYHPGIPMDDQIVGERETPDPYTVLTETGFFPSVNTTVRAHESPEKWLHNPAFLPLTDFLDMQIKLCRNWLLLHDSEITHNSREVVGSIMRGLSEKLVQLNFDPPSPSRLARHNDRSVSPSRASPLLGHRDPSKVSLGSPRASNSPGRGAHLDRLTKDDLDRITILLRKPFKKVDQKTHEAIRRALQESFMFFARSDVNFNPSFRPLWISVYQWQMFCRSFQLPAVTGYSLTELLGFAPKQEPITFVSFLEAVCDLAIATIEKYNYPRAIDQLNVYKDRSDRVTALYRFAEALGMHDERKLEYRKNLRGREKIRITVYLF